MNKPDNKEFSEAIKSLNKNESCIICDVELRLTAERNLEVIGWSAYSNLKNISKEIVISELTSIKELFSEIIVSSTKLIDFLKNANVIFYLFFDDAGKGSFIICSETNGIINWFVNL